MSQADLIMSRSCRHDRLAQLDPRLAGPWHRQLEIEDGWNAFPIPLQKLLGLALLLSRQCCRLTESGITTVILPDLHVR